MIYSLSEVESNLVILKYLKLWPPYYKLNGYLIRKKNLLTWLSFFTINIPWSYEVISTKDIIYLIYLYLKILLAFNK
mgnify:FL=1